MTEWLADHPTEVAWARINDGPRAGGVFSEPDSATLLALVEGLGASWLAHVPPKFTDTLPGLHVWAARSTSIDEVPMLSRGSWIAGCASCAAEDNTYENVLANMGYTRLLEAPLGRLLVWSDFWTAAQIAEIHEKATAEVARLL